MRIAKKLQKCYVCGSLSRQRMILTATVIGGIAVKLPCWVNKCPHCGYVAQKISDKTSVTQKWIADMKETSMPKFKSELAADFFMLYLIADADDKDKNAERAIRQAKRECEAVGDKKNAALCLKYYCKYKHAKLIREMRGYTNE